MSWFSVDVEADGPIPGDYSMVSFGAVLILPNDLTHTFYGKLKPISEKWIPSSLLKDLRKFSGRYTNTYFDEDSIYLTKM